jgi:anti-sigma B factor antagonist
MTVEVMDSPRGWRLAGEFDASCDGELDDAFARLPDTDGRPIEIDLAGVSFIDSAGLRVLIALSNRVRSEGGTLVVNNPSRSVRRLLSITELSGLFGVDGTS